MSSEHHQLSKRLKGIIKSMKKVQKGIHGSEEPASMHELDKLKQLGEEYSSTVQQIARLETKQNTGNT
ncbi:MAG: hypothetical protein R3F02_19960 [Thiolinea sp.]